MVAAAGSTSCFGTGTLPSTCLVYAAKSSGIRHVDHRHRAAEHAADVIVGLLGIGEGTRIVGLHRSIGGEAETLAGAHEQLAVVGRKRHGCRDTSRSE